MKVIAGADSKAILAQLGWPQRTRESVPGKPGGEWEYDCVDGVLVLELSADRSRVFRVFTRPRAGGPAGGAPQAAPGPSG